jgi:hypothetical protein
VKIGIHFIDSTGDVSWEDLTKWKVSLTEYGKGKVVTVLN